MTTTLSEPELQDAHQRFSAAATTLADAVEGLGPEQLRWKPGPKSWSIAEVVEHLNITAAKYEDRVRDAIANARANNIAGTGPFRHKGIVLPWLIRQMTVPGKRLKAPGAFQPGRSDLDYAEVADRFGRFQAMFLEFVESSQGLDLGRIRFASPITRLLRMSLGQCYQLVLTHQDHHFGQIRRVREARGFPAS